MKASRYRDQAPKQRSRKQLPVQKNFRTTEALEKAMVAALMNFNLNVPRRSSRMGSGDLVRAAIIQYCRQLKLPEVDVWLKEHKAQFKELYSPRQGPMKKDKNGILRTVRGYAWHTHYQRHLLRNLNESSVWVTACWNQKVTKRTVTTWSDVTCPKCLLNKKDFDEK